MTFSKHLFAFSILWTLGSTIAWGAPKGGGGSTGVGGGGNAVIIGRHTRLRDLVDVTNCRWIAGADFARDLPALPNLLASLEQVHPALAAAIENEIGTLRVCPQSVPLKRIDTTDGDASIVLRAANGKMLGVRWEKEIYVDARLFSRLPEIDRAYFFFHEVMHSFIPMELPRRNQALRSFVATVRRNEVDPLSVADFRLQSEAAAISVAFFADEKAEAFRVIRRPESSLDERVLAFVALGGCDRLLGFLPSFLRTPENRLAYAISHARTGDYTRCVNPTRHDPQWIYLEGFCTPETNFSAETIDRVSSVGPDLEMEWIFQHGLLGRQFGTAPLLAAGEIRESRIFLPDEMRALQARCSPAEIQAVQNLAHLKTQKLLATLGPKEVLLRYLALGLTSSARVDRFEEWVNAASFIFPAIAPKLTWTELYPLLITRSAEYRVVAQAAGAYGLNRSDLCSILRQSQENQAHALFQTGCAF